MAVGKTAGNKKSSGRVRMVDGKKVVACLYNGKAVGEGKYFAAMVGDQLVLDNNGKPIPFRSVGEMVTPEVKK